MRGFVVVAVLVALPRIAQAAGPACRQPTDESCVALARAVEWQDPTRAAQLRTDGCAAGNAAACRALVVTQDRDAAGKTLARACTLGDAQACWIAKTPLAPYGSPYSAAGQFEQPGDGWADVEADVRAACAASDALACFVVSRRFPAAQGGWRAERQHACDLDTDGEICAVAGGNLIAEPDLSHGLLERLAQLCARDEHHAPACASAAFGLAVERDKRAPGLFTRSCQLGDASACVRIAVDLAQSGKVAAAKKLLGVCDGEGARYCLTLDADAPKLKGASARAMHTLEAACDRGVALACESAGFEARHTDPQHADALFAKQCALTPWRCMLKK